MTNLDTSLFSTVRERLHTAVIGDVMDVLGLTHQFLPPHIRALRPEDILVGRAMPVLEADCAGERISHENRDGAFGCMFDALDSLAQGDVYICSGASARYALWGELMSARATALNAAGCVLDGFHRDTRGILKLDLPVFSHGAYAQDQRVRGRVIDYNCPIEFSNGVRVEPGDLVVGDIDGVVIVPKGRVNDVIDAALKKASGEDEVRDMILGGRSTRSIWDEVGIM